jgi:KaiC/GvpD/RAD55 family RecA-like ATPase
LTPIEQAQTEELPFSTPKQNAFFGHIIANKSKYHQTKNKIKKNWFRDPWTGEAFGFYLNWSEKFDKQNEKLPSPEDVFSSEAMQGLNIDKQNKIKSAVALCSSAASIYDWDAMLSQLSNWLKCRIYLENVTKSTEHFNNKAYDEAYKLLEESVQKYQDVKFFPDDQVDFMDWKNQFDSFLLERKSALTTGLSVMDKLIDPACQSGCLLPGDTTIILASSNVGKTTTMITIASANAKLGKSVLFITHEGRTEDIIGKMWSCVSQKTRSELLNLYTQDEQLFQGTATFLKKNITYVPIMDPEEMYVESVARVIEKKQTERIQSFGKGYDMLVVDYPAKLQAQHTSRVQMAYRQSEHYVYNYFVQLALKHKFHALLAIQTNREASKNNKYQGQHGTENRLVSMEDVSESWGPMTVATNVISLNRNDSYGDKIIFHICKTRSSETGYSVLARSDYHRGRTHGDDLGAVWYKGNSSIAHITPQLLMQYNNQGLPPLEVQKLEAASK